MGKFNSNKSRGRTNPIAKPVKAPSDPELAAIRDKTILPMINDLTSPEAKKRSSAAVAIANIIEDTKFRKLLLREQVVKILLQQTITDSALESKSAGWGILRNLASEEDTDFCVHLYRQDILTAIEGIVTTIIDTIESQGQPISKLPKAKQDLLWTLSDSIVGLISSLGEAQEQIVEAITKSPAVIHFLFVVLNTKSVSERLFGEVLACLATLTEDNQHFSQQIVDRESWLKGLMQLTEHGGAKAVAACAVLHNIFSAMLWFDHNTPIEGASDAMLLPTLIKGMEQIHLRQPLANGSSHSSPEQTLQLALEITASIATSLQEALEHARRNEKEFEGFGDVEVVADDLMIDEIAEPSFEADDDANAGNGEMDDAEMDADMELVAGPDSENEDYLLDGQPTLTTLICTAVPAILSIIKSVSEHDLIKTAALSALNNIAWTVSSIDFPSGGSHFMELWAPLSQRIWSEAVSPVLASNTADIVLASSVTSLAWAVARSLQGQLQLQQDEHRKFMALYQASKGLRVGETNKSANGNDNAANGEEEDAFQNLGVKCIGVLGRLALDPAPITLNREIGIFLITILAALPENSPADAVEALNQIFDIYADSAFVCDEVFWSDGFYKHLEDVTPNAKKMAKSIDKRKYSELRARADEAVLNLVRFLKYKRKERAVRRHS